MLPEAAAHAAANSSEVRRCIQGQEIFAVFDELFGERSI
jgi:hypothetical protein